MRNAAREAALNIIFAKQFNTDYIDALKKKIYKQFSLEGDDLLFAADLVEPATHNVRFLPPLK